MIEVVSPAWFSIVVDGGRYGYADVGVPGSAALDQFAYNFLNYLVGNETGAPVLEVMGNEFCVRLNAEMTCAITGAQVTAYLDDRPITPWYHLPHTKEALSGLRKCWKASATMWVFQVSWRWTGL